ncbi:transmembrane protein 268 isoform X1 [Ictalurus punctatus]|uniref:Transmembrane protein 268 isoform X1 n=2 Tax=Ictalurus punctatus TaxID=7998 RepID=A0A2D0S464_ICTPU|nr:transmembrane protein 268 isoform X1 [Ictalurus punctatus]
MRERERWCDAAFYSMAFVLVLFLVLCFSFADREVLESSERWAYGAVLTASSTVHMADGAGQRNRDGFDPESGSRPSENTRVRRTSSGTSTWTNGQSVVAITTPSILTPSFDLELCLTKLEEEGFHIPAEDFETPLRTALEHPSIKRYLFFNSSLFHFILAPIMYVVLWCALYSSLHLYLNESIMKLWVLCLCVSIVVLVITAVIILVFHYSNKEINVNIDVRLVQVNERLIGYGLLLGVADWIEKCTGKMQLCCVFWDLGPCLRTLTETLEELDLVRDEIKNKLKKRMSHLIVVAEFPLPEPDAGEISEDPDEAYPLLGPGRESRSPHKKREEVTLTQTFSLLPDFTLSYQDIANQLLMIYSAVYVKLLVSERLPSSPCGPLDSERNHCTMASLCLCQYVQYKLLQ